jgi:hypothetical protein
VTKRLASVFHQLKFVYLDEIPEGYDLTWTLFILEVASNLKELYLTVCSYCPLIPPLHLMPTFSSFMYEIQFAG